MMRKMHQRKNTIEASLWLQSQILSLLVANFAQCFQSDESTCDERNIVNTFMVDPKTFSLNLTYYTLEEFLLIIEG